jgi:hypothetical protein
VMGCYYEARSLLSTFDELFPLLCCRDSENVTMMDGKLWYGTYLSIDIQPSSAAPRRSIFGKSVSTGRAGANLCGSPGLHRDLDVLGQQYKPSLY